MTRSELRRGCFFDLQIPRHILEAIRGAKRAAIITHQNADPDALCSAYALGYLLRRLRSGITVQLVTPEGIGKVAERVLERLHIAVHHPESLNEYDIVFTVDTNTLVQLAEYETRLKDYGGVVIVVDHHAPIQRQWRSQPMPS
jgi:nanoRNase/pAp phosphatase (c-di-AMP/oligoRNAs hydrolase)